jgi:GR25 family glycosyltransferase involved in LPS biosynthesis
MARRISNLKLTEQTTFIDGGDRDSQLVQHYANQELGATACLIGHLRALRQLVEDSHPHGCILEDDVLFRFDFISKLNQYIEQHIHRKLIQLFTFMNYNGDCKKGYYGAQGYVISREYAELALQQYDRPLTYWPSNIFPTSEAIIMYSNGICLGNDPIIIEDGLTYTISGQSKPNPTQLEYRIYSYQFGLHRYIGCDPDFKLDLNSLSKFWEYFLDYEHQNAASILDTCQFSDQDTELEKFIYYMLRLYSGWYIYENQDLQDWADRLFICLLEYDLKDFISQYHDDIVEVARFYTPSFKQKKTINKEPDQIEWTDDDNWAKIPNVPYELEINTE